jgi:hypothetical protein
MNADAVQLIKRALYKRADKLIDDVGVGAPVSNGLPAVVGDLLGLALKPQTEKERADAMRRSVLWNLLPGVTRYRLSRRARAVADAAKGKYPYANLIAERLGSAPALLASTGVGAGLGAVIGHLINEDRSSGAGVGALIGAGAGGMAELGARIAAAVHKRRSMDDQRERDSSKARLLAKYLVPGLAGYDYYKRLGASRNIYEDPYNKKLDA